MNSRLPDPLLAGHRRQVTRHILLPLGLFIVLILAAAVLSVLGSSRSPINALHWANISLVFMLIPAMLIGLLALGILALLIYGIVRLRDVLPLYAAQARAFIYRLAVLIHTWSNKAAAPVLKVRGAAAGAHALTSRLKWKNLTPGK